MHKKTITKRMILLVCTQKINFKTEVDLKRINRTNLSVFQLVPKQFLHRYLSRLSKNSFFPSSRHREIPIAPPKLAQYALAVSSLCKDPREFHGHDLISTLQHHEPVHDLEFAYASLAACSAKSHVRKKQIRRLLDIANTAKDHNIGKC